MEEPVKRALMLGAAVIGVLILGVGGFVGFKVSTADFQFPDAPYPEIEATDDPEVIERGEYLVHHVAHCSACHQHRAPDFDFSEAGYDFDPSVPMAGGYAIKAGPFGTFYAQNITPDEETGIGRYTDEQLARMIRHGVGADGQLLPLMRLAVGNMSDEDLVAVMSYLRAQEPKKAAQPQDEFGILAKLLADKFSPRGGPSPEHVAQSDEPSVERGKYLAHGPAMCHECHSPMDPMQGFALAGESFSGAMEPEPDPTKDGWVIIAPNITTDKETGRLGSWDEEQFVTRMKAGRTIKGSKMPWEAFQGMTDADLRSIYRYLKTVKPAKRDVGKTHREG